MSQDKTVEIQRDQLIQQLYAAALNPAAWDDALSTWSRLLDTVNAHLMVWDSNSSALLDSVHTGFDQSVQDKYEAHYANIDPRLRHASHLRDGDWFNCAHVFDASWVDQSEFYQDFLIPSESRWLLGSRLIHHQGLNVYFGVHRAPDQQPFGATELALVRALTPHFQRAVQLWLTTRSLRQQALLGQHGMNAVENGVIMTNRYGLLLHANLQAESMLRAGWPLIVRSGCLQLDSDPLGTDTSLSAALELCACTRQPQWLRVGEWGDEARPLCTLTLISLAQDSVMSDFPTSAEVVLLLSHTRHRRLVTVKQLIALFRLTPAEARLACALASGEGMDFYAQSVGISISTARTQLRSTFEKTGARSQTDLVRLLLMQPSGRSRRI